MKHLRRNREPYYQPPGPRRGMVSALADRPAEVRAAERWLADNRAALAFVSADEGCGCCVHLWRIEGPAEVVATLPPELATDGDWVARRGEWADG